VDAMLAMIAAGSIARVTIATRIIRSPAGDRWDQGDLVASVNGLLIAGELLIHGYAWRIGKDRRAWKQSQGFDEIADGIARFKRDLEGRATEAFGV
jgi:hypothetical protein